MAKILYIFSFLCFLASTTWANNSFATQLDGSLSEDSLVLAKVKPEKIQAKAQTAAIVNNDNPIILRKGELLTINLGEESNFYQVRIHTSMGRLMKKYVDVREKITIHTDLWEKGVYMVVISTEAKREIKKVLITE